MTEWSKWSDCHLRCINESTPLSGIKSGTQTRSRVSHMVGQLITEDCPQREIEERECDVDDGTCFFYRWTTTRKCLQNLHLSDGQCPRLGVSTLRGEENWGAGSVIVVPLLSMHLDGVNKCKLSPLSQRSAHSALCVGDVKKNICNFSASCWYNRDSARLGRFEASPCSSCTSYMHDIDANAPTVCIIMSLLGKNAT